MDKNDNHIIKILHIFFYSPSMHALVDTNTHSILIFKEKRSRAPVNSMQKQNSYYTTPYSKKQNKKKQ